jgi:hypothetical protein
MAHCALYDCVWSTSLSRVQKTCRRLQSRNGDTPALLNVAIQPDLYRRNSLEPLHVKSIIYDVGRGQMPELL